MRELAAQTPSNDCGRVTPDRFVGSRAAPECYRNEGQVAMKLTHEVITKSRRPRRACTCLGCSCAKVGGRDRRYGFLRMVENVVACVRTRRRKKTHGNCLPREGS